MSKTTLKPCPFCGGRAEHRTIPRGPGVMHYVTCTNVDCYVTPTTDALANKGATTRVWNRRFPKAKEETK